MVLTDEQRQKVENNMGLVGKVLKDKVHGGVALGYYSHEDLYQVGCIGLCKAAATDKGIGCFSTYAYRLIWNEICDALIHATRLSQHESTAELQAEDAQSTEGNLPSAGQIALAEAFEGVIRDAPVGIRKGLFTLRLMAQGYSSEDAAAKLGISANSARALASRARKYFRADPRFQELLEV